MPDSEKWITVEVYPDEDEAQQKLKSVSDRAQVVKSDRLGGTELLISVVLPITLKVVDVVVAIMLARKEKSRRRVRISGKPVILDDLSEEEMRNLLKSYVVSEE